MRKPLPRLATFEAWKELVFNTAKASPDCRVGQSMCNEFHLPLALEDQIYENNSIKSVATYLMIEYPPEKQ